MAISIGRILRPCTTSRELQIRMYKCSDLQAALQNMGSMMSLATHAYMTTYILAGVHPLI